ncbi:hypothetical protein HanIR_Chr13g0627641 [Helianthus annuus]|nr:hypothetical protein HanIR_Chr13g0627641 [Helianthus annuus]
MDRLTTSAGHVAGVSSCNRYSRTCGNTSACAQHSRDLHSCQVYKKLQVVSRVLGPSSVPLALLLHSSAINTHFEPGLR